MAVTPKDTAEDYGMTTDDFDVLRDVQAGRHYGDLDEVDGAGESLDPFRDDDGVFGQKEET